MKFPLVRRFNNPRKSKERAYNIRSLSIENFRGFKSLKIEGLGRMNLIAGQNNVGKTALLEALFLHIGPTNPELPLRLHSIRGMEISRVTSESLWTPLFYRFSSTKPITLESTDGVGRKRKLEIRLGPEAENEVTHEEQEEAKAKVQSGSAVTTAPPPNRIQLIYTDTKKKSYVASATIGPHGVRFANLRNPDIVGVYVHARGVGGHKEDADRYSLADVRGEQDAILNALRKVEPRLTRLSVVSSSLGPSIYADIGLGRLVPIQLIGDGTIRLLTMVNTILFARNGFVLIDEIENGLHHSVLTEVFKELLSLARAYNVQVFATTHSAECIKAAHEASSDAPEDLKLIRLDVLEDSVNAVVYEHDQIEA